MQRECSCAGTLLTRFPRQPIQRDLSAGDTRSFQLYPRDSATLLRVIFYGGMRASDRPHRVFSSLSLSLPSLPPFFAPFYFVFQATHDDCSPATELRFAWETVHYQRVKMTGLVRAGLQLCSQRNGWIHSVSYLPCLCSHEIRIECKLILSFFFFF